MGANPISSAGLLPRMPRVRGLTVPSFLRVRLSTRLRRSLSRKGLAKPALQIVFLHIPKAAGTTAKDYLVACVGRRRSRKTVFLSEYFPNDRVSDKDFKMADAAQFVSGHFSWDTLQRLSLRSSLTFTTLCDPAERLWSVYFNLRMTADTNHRKDMQEVYQLAQDLDPEAFFALDDWRIRVLSDNAMVRQLAGGFNQLPATEDEWQERLAQAKQNLLSLDHVCFKTTFDQDFARVLKAARFPVVQAMGRQNVTSDPQLAGTSKSEARAQFIKEAWPVLEPLTRYDRELYAFGLELREAGKI